MAYLPDGLYKIRSIQHGNYAEDWPDNNPGIGIGTYFQNRRRNMWRITRTSSDNTYTIKSAEDSSTMSFIDRSSMPPLVTDRSNARTTWNIVNHGTHVKFHPAGARSGSLAVGTSFYHQWNYLYLLANDDNSLSQRWEFQRVDESGNPLTTSWSAPNIGRPSTNSTPQSRPVSGSGVGGSNPPSTTGNPTPTSQTPTPNTSTPNNADHPGRPTQPTPSGNSTSSNPQPNSSSPGTTTQPPTSGSQEVPQGTGGSSTKTSSANPPTSFQSRFFPLSAEQAKALGPYDIIVVGTGIGGGVLARDLFDTNVKLGESAKSVLVIERGDLVFHSHCLNTARPMGLGKDRGQQNDSFFASFKDDYVFTDEESRKQWKGGPMYCLGGRSAAWGLFAPRVHDETLREFFPSDVTRDLLNEYYEKAEILMNLSLPETRPLHQHLMERLNMDADAGVKSRLQNLRAGNVSDPNLNVQWQWGRIASEFRQAQNFDFAEGAYSTIDKLLEIVMSKPKGADGRDAEHPKFKMLLGAEARSLTWTTHQGGSVPSVKGVVVRTAAGDHEIEVTPGSGRVVLCAGSVASPTILLRSGVTLTDRSMGGCRLTDHDIIFRAKSFRYTNPAVRREVGSMKLQTYADLGGRNVVLANMSIDASSFLPRGRAGDNTLPKFIMVFIMRAPLKPENTVKLVNDEPQVTITRAPVRISAAQRNEDLQKMKALTESVMETIQRVLQIEFVDQDGDTNDFKYLELGGVAHELGTVPMPMGDDPSESYCVDSNLKLRDREGVYVCDLSVFPYSPEANPTLTLAALSLRLSRHLLPRLNVVVDQADSYIVHIVNHSGQDVRVWLSNRAGVSDEDAKTEGVELAPGQQAQWKRKEGMPEAVFVFRCDQTARWKYVKVPELLVGVPGKVLAIM